MKSKKESRSPGTFEYVAIMFNLANFRDILNEQNYYTNYLNVA